MPRGLGKPLTPQPHPEPRYTSGPHGSLSLAGISLSTGSGLKIQIPHCHHLFQASSISSYKFSPPSTLLKSDSPRMSQDFPLPYVWKVM